MDPKAGGKNADEIKETQKKMQTYFKDVIAPNFKDYDFYTSKTADSDGLYELLEFEDITLGHMKHLLTKICLAGLCF